MILSVGNLLAESNAVVTGDHIVYKLGTHGQQYIDKERFANLGGINLASVLRGCVENAIANGLNINDIRNVGILGMAYGSIPYTITIAEALENYYGRTSKFFPARTELALDNVGKKIQIIPEKFFEAYAGKFFIGVEDIVNNGTTLREGRDVLAAIGSTMFAAISIVDRGGQTAESLGISQYFPAFRVSMSQVDPRIHICPDCAAGKPINTKLGKGKLWVNLFGQPPYPPGMDFSAFWEK